MYIIRKVRKDEIADLRELGEETFVKAFEDQNNPDDFKQYLSESFSLASIKGQIEDPDSIFYFVEKGDQKIGYLKLNRGSAQTEQELENAIEIERIYLLPGHQGQGIGAQLIEKSIAIAKEEGFSTVWLGVWEENPAAIKFYKRHGFVQFAQHKFMVGSDEQTDAMMKLEL